MGEIAEAIKSHKWSEFIRPLMQKDEVLNWCLVSDYLAIHGESTHSEIKKGTGLSDSSLRDVLLHARKHNKLKKINPESKHPRYYFKISLDDDGFVKTPSIANDAKKLLRFEVYDNPKFTPSQKAEISAPYIFNLLNELSKLNQKNMIDGFSKKVTDSSEVRFAEGMIRLNFKFAEKYGFDKQLYKKLNALIGSPYDKKTVKNVNQQTKFLYNKFKKNN